jgi:hypothetical protein
MRIDLEYLGIPSDVPQNGVADHLVWRERGLNRH